MKTTDAARRRGRRLLVFGAGSGGRILGGRTEARTEAGIFGSCSPPLAGGGARAPDFSNPADRERD
jgi:hypothetical protein